MHEDEAGSFIDQYLHLLGNPAHWAFELTLIVLIDILILGLAYPFIKAWIANHDRTKHPKEVCDHVDTDSAP